MIGPLLEFPARTIRYRLCVPACILRPAKPDDLPFLRQLYHSFRRDELARIPWSQEDKQAFLDQQFDFQHCYYVAAFPQTDFLIIEKDGTAIGRLYIDCDADIWHIVDIGFLPEWRNLGFGSGTLKAIQHAAAIGGIPGIVLHVDRNNRRAYDLYMALGFMVVETTVTHARMEWRSHRLLPETADEPSGVN
ncbi:GNAT family N-acetyltransferase [Rhizobium chutanense]|uniref:GNAT family N-acetyltransferase n=1 Tax=Rhizobium chutanense TaxID=2035448 RepID=A0A2A6JDP1_9HYPH|nr:N-acetyltransferase [Rhizobium chutanense]PDT04271.1 GNAT family N-acetyltransferase [Rhizobium chutanense]